MVDAGRILVVEDDVMLSDMLALIMENEGYDVSIANNATEALASLQNINPGAILLDVGLPDLNGWDLCRQMRQMGVTAPILMLTGAAETAQIVRGLEAGANDYIVKPHSAPTLLARLRAQMRTWENTETAAFSVGPWEFRPSARALVNPLNGRRQGLTSREVAMLRRLMFARGEQVARETLIREVWSEAEQIVQHTLETHVYRLSQKLEANPAEPKILVTAPGGYRLIANPAKEELSPPISWQLRPFQAAKQREGEGEPPRRG